MEYKNLIGGAINDKISIYNCDCMELLRQTPDNYYSLALVDPPYGIGFGKFNRTNTDVATGIKVKANKYKNSDWDSGVPSIEYFEELKRVSENQIVFGGNYFIELAKKETPNLKSIHQFNEYINKSSENWLFWYKQNPVPNFADGELAWLSFNHNKQFDYKYFGNIEGKTSASTKHHPTQKPIDLYKFCLNEYAKPNDKILDTHLGSGSIAIACHDYGFDLTACELDKDYYEAALKRLKQHQSQTTLF